MRSSNTPTHDPNLIGAQRLWFSLALLLALASCSGPPSPVVEDKSSFPEPARILAQDGVLATTLYTQFATAKVGGAADGEGNRITEIWTRAYSSQPADPNNPVNELPGPSLVFHPGDWLQITLHNQLNRSANAWLNDYQDNIQNTPGSGNQDEIAEHLPSDLNIPHNANNTNLHVHGLHVDPKEDDVTLMILPEDDDPSFYPPDIQHLVPDHDRWWVWDFGYRIPADHLPGTYWYHSHQHGSTSTQVENGMAGTLLIRPQNDEDDLAPGLWHDDPAQSHDRVLMFQEIANYGAQQGPGVNLSDPNQASQVDNYTSNWPDIAVNGERQPTLTLAPGQTERWRFIDGGANHRTAAFLWVGELVLPETISTDFRAQLAAITDFESAKPYVQIGGAGTFSETFQVGIKPFPGTVQLVALDGVTLRAAVEISATRPVLLGPGNRADLYIQADPAATGAYFVGKNYNVAPPQAILAQNADYGDLFQDDDAGFWRYQALTTLAGGTNVSNYLVTPDGSISTENIGFANLNADPYNLGVRLKGFPQNWPKTIQANGAISGTDVTETSLVPLITGKVEGDLLAAVPVAGAAFESLQLPATGIGWAPLSGAGGVADAQVLMTIQVTGTAASDSPPPPNDQRLNQLSPTGDPSTTLLKRVDDQGQLAPGIPAYVAPIADEDISNRQVIVFDQSGITFNYQRAITATEQSIPTTIQQFWLNGRQFDLNDFVGNPNANALIQTPVPETVSDPYTGRVLGSYTFKSGKFTNQVTIDGQPAAYLTNPGYYVPVIEQDGYFNYDYGNVTAPPTFQQITGLDQPRQPEATTAEEWLVINNSRIFHPFHIHINPFFVTEVGQLSYDEKSKTWQMKTLQPDDPLGYVLNNWLDVVTLPPQGYVKFRTWINMPDQTPAQPGNPDTDFIVKDNANIFGAWVYHCHILRHEDRGMMMVVSVKPKAMESSAHSH